MDLEKLRAEIDGKKKRIDERKNILGETVVKKQTGDQFLRELIHTQKTGQETNASIKVRAVDKLAESKETGKPIDPSILEHVGKPIEQNNNPSKGNNPQQYRTASMDAREEARKLRESNNNYNYNATSNKGLADAISQYDRIPPVGAPMNNNGMLTEQQMMEKFGRGNGMVSAPNNFINEQVINVTRELLNENFGKLYAEAMKNSIIESYKAEVVKEALKENRSVIEQIVRETIIDLQKKAQSKN